MIARILRQVIGWAFCAVGEHESIIGVQATSCIGQDVTLHQCRHCGLLYWVFDRGVRDA